MLVGSVLFCKYRLESLLGQGGMGSVWRAEHLGFKAPVAVKLMDAERAQTAEGLARFHREAHAAAVIRSPHVVQVLDHGLDEETDTPFIVMELLEGETLGKRLRRAGQLSLAATAWVVADVCRALTRAHQAGIVHRDLKPENIFLVQEEEREIAKVLDFGVAKTNAVTVGLGESTRTGDLLGTPYYMSPEQIRGARDVDGRSDLWALAVIACECVTGKRPFVGDTVGGLAVAICSDPIPSASSLGPASPAFEAWLERALRREPDQRFQNARELSESLLALASETAAAATASSPALADRKEPSQAGAGADDAPVLTPLSNTLGAQTASVVPIRVSPVTVLTLAIAALALFGVATWSPSAPAPRRADTPVTVATPAPAEVVPVAATTPVIPAPSEVTTDSMRGRPIGAEVQGLTEPPEVQQVRALRPRKRAASIEVERALAKPTTPHDSGASTPPRVRPKLMQALSGDR
jgi:hypothetical protein